MDRKVYKYYDMVLGAFVAVLLTSAIVGAPKVSSLFGRSFGAAVIFFPISFIFGDILTEVYGYAKARRVVWSGFGALLFVSLMSVVVTAMPPAPEWKDQAAYETVFGTTPRIAIASLLGYWGGEFTNSYVLAKMKVWMSGRQLWVRTIGSTIVGEAIDTLIFYPLAFGGIWSGHLLVEVMISNYFIKVAVEVVFTPITYWIVHFLKTREHEDYYDRTTDFNPFRLE